MKPNLHRKNYVLDVRKLQRAKKRLGTRTETETIHKLLTLPPVRPTSQKL